MEGAGGDTSRLPHLGRRRDSPCPRLMTAVNGSLREVVQRRSGGFTTRFSAGTIAMSLIPITMSCAG